MKFSRFGVLACVITPFTFTSSQQFNLSDSLNSFAVNLLGETSNQAGEFLNIALSTYTVWTLMTLIAEGSLDNTARQLENTLNIPSDKTNMRVNFQNLSRNLQTSSNGVKLEFDTAMFTNKEFPVKKSFQGLSQQFYDVKINPLNFNKPSQAAEIINKYVAQATKNRINPFVNAGDVMNAQVFLASILFFKGEWKTPFNKSETHRETFYDEKNYKIGEVDMMFRVGKFPFARIERLNAFAIELPYGSDGKMSMIVILPFKGVSLTDLLNLMSRTPFASILQDLEESARIFIDEDVHVYLPKFTIQSDFNLNVVLSKIGIKDVFDITKANLLGIFDHYLYLSRLIQRAEIEVNEEGTTASSATGASFANKSTPPKFRANKPFLYFIVDNVSRSVIFAGKVSNPNTLK